MPKRTRRNHSSEQKAVLCFIPIETLASLRGLTFTHDRLGHLSADWRDGAEGRLGPRRCPGCRHGRIPTAASGAR